MKWMRADWYLRGSSPVKMLTCANIAYIWYQIYRNILDDCKWSEQRKWYLFNISKRRESRRHKKSPIYISRFQDAPYALWDDTEQMLRIRYDSDVLHDCPYITFDYEFINEPPPLTAPTHHHHNTLPLLEHMCRILHFAIKCYRHTITVALFTKLL